ncbi:hypothetical protein LTS12_026898, partial [Elasticomyces elasticus]
HALIKRGHSKSQFAIEYSYRVRQSHPQTWLLWIQAGSAVRFEQGIREVAECMKIRGRDEQNVDIYGLTRSWLADKRHGSWKIILDNADDASVLVTSRADGQEGTTALPLQGCIPLCDHGSVLFTTRSQHEAQQLVEYDETIDVRPMSKAEGVALLEKKLGQEAERYLLKELVEVLECMPLALTQAAAYLKRRGRRSSVGQYIEELQASPLSQMSLLDRDHGDHRRDVTATNLIFRTWQISFDHIRTKRRTAAELLSMMCFCDRQAIPDFLLRTQQGEQRDSVQTFEDDVEMLLGFSFISTLGQAMPLGSTFTNSGAFGHIDTIDSNSPRTDKTAPLAGIF